MGRNKMDDEKRKDIYLKMRMSKSEMKVLAELANRLNLTKSDTIRIAILNLLNSRHKQLS